MKKRKPLNWKQLKHNSSETYHTNFNEEKKTENKCTLDGINPKKIKRDLYSKYTDLLLKIEGTNIGKLKRICSTLTSIPKTLNEKINNSIAMDEKIRESYRKYIKHLLGKKEPKKRDEEEEKNTKKWSIYTK